MPEMTAANMDFKPGFANIKAEHRKCAEGLESDAPKIMTDAYDITRGEPGGREP